MFKKQYFRLYLYLISLSMLIVFLITYKIICVDNNKKLFDIVIRNIYPQMTLTP